MRLLPPDYPHVQGKGEQQIPLGEVEGETLVKLTVQVPLIFFFKAKANMSYVQIMSSGHTVYINIILEYMILEVRLVYGKAKGICNIFTIFVASKGRNTDI